MFFNKQPNYMEMLAKLLANGENRESFLGVKSVRMPTPQQVLDRAAALAHHSSSKEYLMYAEEVWSRVLNHLDIVLDDKSSDEKVKFHRGALREALDLLRVSYHARQVAEEAAKQVESSSQQ